MAWTEETPPRPVDPYGVSKLEAEAVVRQTAADAGLHAPILRFPLVYGPGMKGNMLRLFRAVDRGWRFRSFESATAGVRRQCGGRSHRVPRNACSGTGNVPRE